MAAALNGVAILYRFGHEWRLSQEHAEALVALSTEHALGILALGMVHQGTAMAAQGQVEAGLAQTHQGLTAYQTTGAAGGQPTHLGQLAEIYGKVGQIETGFALLTEAFALVERTADRHFEAELYRVKGELLLTQAIPNPQQAERCFQQALAIARQQHAKAWELRTAVRLSRLWQQQGKRDAARQLLAEVYGWFTEGFDISDLQEAQRLLRQLSAAS